MAFGFEGVLGLRVLAFGVSGCRVQGLGLKGLQKQTPGSLRQAVLNDLNLHCKGSSLS